MSENQQAVPGPIVTTVESPESWQRVVKVEISRAHFDSEFAKHLKKAAKTHHKPGFRKGKTPRAIVEKELGPMVRMDTVEGLVPQAWMTGLLEHKLNPITDPALENMVFEDEGPLTFDLVVEVRPQVEAADYDGLPVSKRMVAVTDKDINEVLERLQESRATFEKVDRAAAEGDQILMDLVPGTWDGQPDEAKIIEDQKLVLGAEGNMPAFNEVLVGVKAGDVRDVEVLYAADHPNEQLKGQTITFNCRIKEVGAKTAPEINDELAATIAEGKTLAELQDEIRQDLEQESEKRVVQELDHQLLAELVRRNPVELPPSMVDKYLESGLEEAHKRNQQLGRPNSEEEDQEYRTAGRPHAEKALKGMLLLESIQSKEDIKVSDEDVDERIEEIAGQNGFDVDRYREFVNSGDEKQRMEYDLLERRTYDFLLSRAEITEVSADTDVIAEEE